MASHLCSAMYDTLGAILYRFRHTAAVSSRTLMLHLNAHSFMSACLLVSRTKIHPTVLRIRKLGRIFVIYVCLPLNGFGRFEHLNLGYSKHFSFKNCVINHSEHANNVAQKTAEVT